MKIAISILTLAFLVLFEPLHVHAQTQPSYVLKEKNPGAAFLMALIIPGSGQMYNNQPALGLATFGGVAALCGGGVGLLKAYQNSEGYYGFYSYGQNQRYQSAAIALFALAGAMHVAAFIYAPLKSNKINKARFGDDYMSKADLPGYYYSFGLTRSGGIGATLNFR